MQAFEKLLFDILNIGLFKYGIKNGRYIDHIVKPLNDNNNIIDLEEDNNTNCDVN